MATPIIIPPSIKKGATIGVIAPAAQLVDEDLFARGLNILKEMGFEVRFPRELWPGYGYLANNDKKRGVEFNKMWASSEVDALLTMRGGFGSLRMVEEIDPNIIKSSPKMLIGFSDITILNSVMFGRFNLMSFHGPVLTSLPTSSKGALDRFYHCLTGKWEKSIILEKVEVLRGTDGESEGRLIGGNLSTLLTLFGTKYDLDYSGCILFIEDVGEPLYKIDRMLTQLFMTGRLKNIKALIIGDFSNSEIQDQVERLRYKEFIWNRILELAASYSYPVIAEFPTGHCSENLTLPYGAIAKLDLKTMKLSFAQ